MDEKDVTLPMDEGPDRPELADPPMLEAEPEPAEAKAEAEQPRGPDGKFASKEKGETEPPAQVEAPPASEPDNVPVRALQDERRKRQELEDQVRQLQAQVNQPRQQEPPPDFWENPQAFMAKAFEQHSEQLLQRFQQQQTLERLTASEIAAKARHTDYDDAFRAFQQAANTNPSLIQQMTVANDPAEFAYSTGKRALDLEKVGSLDALIAQERAKWEAEAKAALPKPNFPTSTASDGSVNSRSGPAWVPGDVRLPMDT